MHAFDVLGDPVRRFILERLAEGQLTASEVAAAVGQAFGITPAATSQHLKVLRDHGFADVEPAGARRIYSVGSAPFAEIDQWLDHFRRFWEPHLDALEAEVARGKSAPAGRPRKR
ncbi:ArsR/SmtB family transcription factor [Pseudooceanicola sp. LIPI14-2-Ac024]|uniref:ArsR/SmtB family transcription factor n=1 Tax=Pseudooceanicola sp. LIPI14-2-Ac024 TaxID=3344875 RepID=UPI0035CF43BB